MRKKIMVVGSLNIDLVATAERLPQAGETVLGKTFSTFPGGKGANQAVAAAKLGAEVIMAGCVGVDNFARELLHSLASVNVDTRFIRQVSVATGVALISVDACASNTIIVVPGANNDCSPDDVNRVLAETSEPGILLVQHEIPALTVDYAIKTAKRLGWTIIVNPAPARPITPVLPLIDILIPNETELAILTGCQTSTATEVSAAARRLVNAGAKTVVVTLGDKGALCCTMEGVTPIPPVPVQAVDTTAAGDSYTGAVAAALAVNKDLLPALQFAAAAAALSVTRPGAQPALPCRGEVEQFMKERRLTK